MQQRYYDPLMGRFITADPENVGDSGQNFARYKYAANNPNKSYDPDGRLDGERHDYRNEKKRERIANFVGSVQRDLAIVRKHPDGAEKIEKVISDRRAGLVGVERVREIVNAAVDRSLLNNPWAVANSIDGSERYVPTEQGLVDLAHVAAASSVLLGNLLGDIRETLFTSTYSSGMSEDYVAHDAAADGYSSADPGQAAADFIRNLGPLHVQEAAEALEDIDP